MTPNTRKPTVEDKPAKQKKFHNWAQYNDEMPRIVIRLTPMEKDWIIRAAELKGMTTSDFILECIGMPRSKNRKRGAGHKHTYSAIPDPNNTTDTTTKG